MRKSNGAFLVGVVLLVAGLAAAAYGYYLYDGMSKSLSGVLGKVGKALTGKSNAETRAFAFMIGGGAVALFGAFIAFFRGRR